MKTESNKMVFEPNNYFFYQEGEWDYDTAKNIFLRSEKSEQKLWSARLSTGLFGLPTCPAGNKGPKNINEVILGLGNEGLIKLINMGFITCPICKPEKSIDNFWQIVQKAVKDNYKIENYEEFIDKNILKFDARRVDWHSVFKIIPNQPDRFYLPEHLNPIEIQNFRDILENNNKFNSVLGYYDLNAETRFTRY